MVWQKLLYLRQPYPDNYVDESFLDGLQRNLRVRIYSYEWLVLHSGSIVQQITAILIFTALFIHISLGWISAKLLLALANALTFIGYLSWMSYVCFRGSEYKPIGKQIAKSGVIFILVLLGLTPPLRHLTEDISSDTIYAMATICFVANLTLFDYSALPEAGVSSSDNLSLNAAFLAAILLASRLPSQSHVFALATLAVNWFALFPLLRRTIKHRLGFLPDITVTISLSLLVLFLFWPLSKLVATSILLAILTVTFLLPAFFVYLQQHKMEISGPWDEAVVSLNSVRRNPFRTS